MIYVQNRDDRTICVCLAVFICIGNWADSFLIGRNQNHQQMVLTKQQQNSLRRALYHARLGIDAFCKAPTITVLFDGRLLTCPERALLTQNTTPASNTQSKLEYVWQLSINVKSLLASYDQFAEVTCNMDHILRYIRSIKADIIPTQTDTAKNDEEQNNLATALSYLGKIHATLSTMYSGA